MCIRALDYIPPVDLTFGEYLRALVTADFDLVSNDDLRYRVSVLSAFRDWGIYPDDVRSLSVESLLWKPPERDTLRLVDQEFLARCRFERWTQSGDRLASFLRMNRHSRMFHQWLRDKVRGTELDRGLGLALGGDAPGGIRRDKQGHPVFEVHSMRPCRRIGPDGQQLTDLVVEVVQQRLGFLDEDRQRRVDTGVIPYDQARKLSDFAYRGGCTLIIDPTSGAVRYCIRKSIRKSLDAPWSDERLLRERRFRQGAFGDSVGGIYLSDADSTNPFALLHATS
jgi:hypothetical protein